jgi:hypothetical protein
MIPQDFVGNDSQGICRNCFPSFVVLGNDSQAFSRNCFPNKGGVGKGISHGKVWFPKACFREMLKPIVDYYIKMRFPKRGGGFPIPGVSRESDSQKAGVLGMVPGVPRESDSQKAGVLGMIPKTLAGNDSQGFSGK